MSAPKSKGFCKKGVAKVLSTANNISLALAILLNALMSTILIIGLVGLSTQIICVFTFIKASTLVTFCISVK